MSGRPRRTRWALLAAGLLTATTARGQIPEIYFSPPRDISNNSALSQGAAITQDAAHAIYLGWEESGGLLFVRSADGGLTFSPPGQMGPAPHPDFGNGQLSLGGGATGVLHAAFTSFDGVFGGAEVLYTRTNDAGSTFSPPALISTVDDFNSTAPQVAAGWAVAVAWGDADLSTGENAVMYRQSLDGGATFSPPQRLSTLGLGFEGCPSLALAGTGTAYVAWLESFQQQSADVYRIVFSRSVDGGVTFSPPVPISSPQTQTAWCPRLVVDGKGTIFVASWEESAAGAHMFFVRSTDGGASFSDPTVIHDGGAAPHSPRAVVTSEGTVFVNWRTGPYDSYRCRLAAVRADGTYSAPVEPPYCGPMSARTPGVLHVTWFDFPRPGQNADVFYGRGEIRPSAVPRSFYTVPPCRVADTRSAEGPDLAANTRRSFSVGGRCGIPFDAIAVAANVTTVQPSDIGDLRVYGAGGFVPDASTINFVPGSTRANNATPALGTDAAVTVQCDMPLASTGSTHLVLDVYGYFR